MARPAVPLVYIIAVAPAFALAFTLALAFALALPLALALALTAAAPAFALPLALPFAPTPSTAPARISSPAPMTTAPAAALIADAIAGVAAVRPVAAPAAHTPRRGTPITRLCAAILRVVARPTVHVARPRRFTRTAADLLQLSAVPFGLRVRLGVLFLLLGLLLLILRRCLAVTGRQQVAGGSNPDH